MNNVVDWVLNEQKLIHEEIQPLLYENLHEVFRNENLLQTSIIDHFPY
jgi:hypothetical protein